MNGRRDEPRGRRVGDPWFIGGSALAVLATAALVLADDLRWLRLGIIAALWAALLAAFLASKYRRQVESTQDSVVEAQAVYELELEREIAARREYELRAEAEIRRTVEAESRDQLAALRAEVNALRESLQQLFGGEVLYERVALTAQSTRMRSLQDDPKYLSSATPQAQISSASQTRLSDNGDLRTELIARVLETDAPVRLQPRREPTRSPHREPARPAQRETTRPPGPREPSRRGGGESRPPESRPPTVDLPKRPNSGASLFSAEPFSLRADSDNGSANRDNEFAKSFDLDWLAPVAEPADSAPARQQNLSAAFPPRKSSENPQPEPGESESPIVARGEVQERLRQIQSENRQGGRRRRPEPAEDMSTGGGRRRKPDDAGINLFESATGARAGRHADPAVPPSSAENAGGSHTEGRSVSELLSALGSRETPRRRRRREDDGS